MNNQLCSNAEVKASSPIRTSLFEREGSMWGSLKRPSLRHEDDIFPYSFKAIRKRLGIPEPSTRKTDMVKDSRSDDSEFCHELLTKYGFTQDQMHRAAERFRLGRSKSGKTIYWMIDDLGRCIDGRLGNTWVSTLLKARYPAAAPYLRIEHCLFGLHQVSLAEESPIGIIETEQSAVILSEVCPDLTWLAYSYNSNLTIDRLEPLQGHKVTIYPRTDPYMEYFMVALELSDQAKHVYQDLDISVSTFLEDHATEEQKSRNIDLVGFLFDSS